MRLSHVSKILKSILYVVQIHDQAKGITYIVLRMRKSSMINECSLPPSHSLHIINRQTKSEKSDVNMDKCCQILTVGANHSISSVIEITRPNHGQGSSPMRNERFTLWLVCPLFLNHGIPLPTKGTKINKQGSRSMFILHFVPLKTICSLEILLSEHLIYAVS